MIPILLMYAAIAGLYLVVLPTIIVLYLQQRWNPSGSWEKVVIFFLVFFFFPGTLLVSPFINFRPALRIVD